jgi:ABC-2 type transport system ATP-binding protein
MDTVLEAADLTKHYEDFSLRGVSLTVRRGSVSGIFGPNAAGKSTLLRMLAGQTPVPAGTLRVLGESFDGAERDLKNRIGYVPQEPVFYETKTVEWHARFAAPCFARWDGAGFHRLLEEALAFSHGAELLILDEPTAGLDIVHRRSLLDRLRAVANGGEATVVVASHITDGLDEIAEDITFLHDGRVVLQENADDVATTWKWVVYREGALDRAVEERFASVRHTAVGCRGLTNDLAAVRDAIAPALASGDARIDHASLEDILLSFIEGA